jgi:TonB family protein
MFDECRLHLHLHVAPSRGATWRIKYRLGGAEQLLTIAPIPSFRSMRRAATSRWPASRLRAASSRRRVRGGGRGADDLRAGRALLARPLPVRLAARLAIPAIIMGNPVEWFGPDQYPIDAFKGQRQGRVVADISVDLTGVAKGCTIEVSSGTTSLDKATCDTALAHASFNSATDCNGKPITSIYKLQSIGCSQMKCQRRCQGCFAECKRRVSNRCRGGRHGGYNAVPSLKRGTHLMFAQILSQDREFHGRSFVTQEEEQL